MKQNLVSSLFVPLRSFLSGCLLCVIFVPHASAHLMVAQHGTINIVGDGAFLVLSLPVSAFDNIDDDGDKQLSRTEFAKYQPVLVSVINEKMKLFEKDTPRPLQGMMLSPVAPHKNPLAPADQLVIMGRFQLADINNPLTFHLELFGQKPQEQQQEILFSYPAKSLKNKIVLTPKLTNAVLFPNSIKTEKAKVSFSESTSK